jgi:hypothetical protein
MNVRIVKKKNKYTNRVAHGHQTFNYGAGDFGKQFGRGGGMKKALVSEYAYSKEHHHSKYIYKHL